MSILRILSSLGRLRSRFGYTVQQCPAFYLPSAPFTAEYTFIVEADCGTRVFLNGQPIIADRMPPPSAKDALGEKEVAILPPSDHDGPKQVESAPVVLNGGEKNRIRWDARMSQVILLELSKILFFEIFVCLNSTISPRVEMIHSNHLRWNNPGIAACEYPTESCFECRRCFYQTDVETSRGQVSGHTEKLLLPIEF